MTAATSSTAADPAHDFDICGPLPTGTTMLEASAGTGKTFTIAALATRYVAEGHAELSQLMLVTFGRAATRELRERVRERLVAAERSLADPDSARGSGDDLVRLLADASDEQVAMRHRRLTAARADFDAATIDTTHAFCQHMLTGLGIAADDDAGAVFVESIDDLVVEVVDDLYLRKWGTPHAEPPLLSYRQALDLARCVVGDRHTALVPVDAPAESPPAQRVAFAQAVRTEVELRKRRRGLRDFDDLLTRLHGSMSDPVTGSVARQRIRSRYRVVMVDEFQDTDPVQWDILRMAFHGHTTLVLIGDPKQAIYAFRGGDVTTYLQAARQASTRSTLGLNWRCDADLLLALEQVFRGAALGDPDIVVRPVAAAQRGPRLTGPPAGAALRVRLATRQLLSGGTGRVPGVAAVRELVAADVARDIVELLESSARLCLAGTVRPVRAGDVAVLVGTNKQATLVRTALAAVGVPAVLGGTTSVYTTDMAAQWLVLLRALEQPHREGLAKAAALTDFVGWSAEQLAQAGDDAMDDLGPMLTRWAAVLARRGVPALLELVTEEADLSGRLLVLERGERLLTDLRHVAETLHAAVVTEHVGATVLGDWLRRRIDAAATETTEERSRRLESDADAVQVVTVHRSKGLEFPVAYVPYGWDKYPRTPAVPRFHADDGTRTLDVGGADGGAFETNCAAHDAEESGEDLRQLYVALTRAQCHAVTWWAPSGQNTTASPLHRLLFGGHRAGATPDDSVPVLGDERAAERLTALARASGGRLAVQAVQPHPDRPVRWSPGPSGQPLLDVARFDRSLDTQWRRTSYSGLTAAHPASEPQGVGSEPDERQLDDEVADGSHRTAEREPGAEALRAVVSSMGGLPAGAAFGSTVHSVLERVDTGAADLAVELSGRCREVLDRRFGSTLDPDVLAAALQPAMETPLGPLADGLRLRDVTVADRLAELDFELPLAGGDATVVPGATVGTVAALLRRHLAPADPFAAYPDLLAELPDQQLRGYLVGSLDAVLRVRDRSGQPRYVVADYKTNWLGGGWPGQQQPLTAWDYRPDALAAAMLAAHYPLQALLYLVALHRYLRWRQPGYDPDRHLGGALYLFVRGMCGPDTPAVDGVPCGVFGWRPPPGLVARLAAELAGGER